MRSRGRQNARGWRSATAVLSALVRACSLRDVCGPTHAGVLLVVARYVVVKGPPHTRELFFHSTLLVTLSFLIHRDNNITVNPPVQP